MLRKVIKTGKYHSSLFKAILKHCVPGSVWFTVFTPQILHRQRCNDRSSRLGDVQVRSGDGAGGLVDYTKVDFTSLVHYILLPLV